MTAKPAPSGQEGSETKPAAGDGKGGGSQAQQDQ